MSAESDPKPRYILGWEIRRAPRRSHSLPLALILTLAGLMAVAIHDIVYRQTGGTDFEIFGVISHAGADMLIVTLILAIIAGLHERQRS